MSEHYETEDFGGLKSGVGIHVEAADAVAPTVIAVRTLEGGWDADVYATDTDPTGFEGLEEWGEPIGGVTEAGTSAEIQLDSTAANRYFLLWFTKPPPSTEDPGRFRAEVSDIELVE